MEKFKLSNLRELSTEEQLDLLGGTCSNGCKCSCGTCNCYGTGQDAAGQAATDGANEGVKEKAS